MYFPIYKNMRKLSQCLINAFTLIQKRQIIIIIKVQVIDLKLAYALY